MNINSLLSEDYVVTISDKEYEQQVKTNTFFQCNHCEKENNRIDIDVYDRVLYDIEELLSPQKIIKSWVCHFCYKVNDVRSTHIVSEESSQPFFRRVIPVAPFRYSTLATRLVYHQKFLEWFYDFSEMLEHSMSLYRIEYISQHGEDMHESTTYKDLGGD
jgi:hypothetical protein